MIYFLSTDPTDQLMTISLMTSAPGYVIDGCLYMNKRDS